MRVLITGVRGFVGGHLAAFCAEQGAQVVGLGRGASGAGFVTADLVEANAARRAVREARPERVFHLAAEASVARSWAAPGDTIASNVTMTLNLLEAVRREATDTPVLVASTGEVYGPVEAGRQPIAEDEPARPQNPYAVSKGAAELLAGFYGDAHGLPVTRTRAFNHAGPGQSDDYVVSAFARQIAEAEAAGLNEMELVTGDLEPRRDFTDVRDVVRAYWTLLSAARSGVYNVCSGRATAIVDILARLSEQTAVEIRQRTDPARLRKHEVMEIRGSHEKLSAATGWQPEISLDATLRDTLDWWRSKVRS